VAKIYPYQLDECDRRCPSFSGITTTSDLVVCMMEKKLFDPVEEGIRDRAGTPTKKRFPSFCPLQDALV